MRGLGLGLGLFSQDAFGGAVAATFPLDGLSVTPAVLYGTRRLRGAYLGPCFRVRETGGNTELDIGFNADGTLNTTALLAHVGANNGRIVRWYDQSGNNNYANDPVGSLLRQPRIALAGVLDTMNGKPTVYFDPTSTADIDAKSLCSINYFGPSPVVHAVGNYISDTDRLYSRLVGLPNLRNGTDWDGTTKISPLQARSLDAIFAQEFNSIVRANSSPLIQDTNIRFRARVNNGTPGSLELQVSNGANNTVGGIALVAVDATYARLSGTGNTEQWSGPVPFLCIFAGANQPSAADEALIVAFEQSEYGVA